MAPKKDIVYVKKGKSKFVAPSRRMIIDFDNNQDLVYVPPSSTTPTTEATVTRGTPGRWIPA